MIPERGFEVLGYSESRIAPRSNKNDRRWSVSGTHLLDKWARVPTYNSLSHAILNLTYRSDGAEGGTLSRGMAWNEARFFHTPKPRRILHRWENERGYYAKCYPFVSRGIESGRNTSCRVEWLKKRAVINRDGPPTAIFIHFVRGGKPSSALEASKPLTYSTEGIYEQQALHNRLKGRFFSDGVYRKGHLLSETF